MDARSKKKRRGVIIVALVLAFIGYPLSIGPAAMVVQMIDSDWSEQAFQAIYAPILAIPSPIDRLIAAWMNWWQ
jgi:hypothetical protein